MKDDIIDDLHKFIDSEKTSLLHYKINTRTKFGNFCNNTINKIYNEYQKNNRIINFTCSDHEKNTSIDIIKYFYNNAVEGVNKKYINDLYEKKIQSFFIPEHPFIKLYFFEEDNDNNKNLINILLKRLIVMTKIFFCVEPNNDFDKTETKFKEQYFGCNTNINMNSIPHSINIDLNNRKRIIPTKLSKDTTQNDINFYDTGLCSTAYTSRDKNSDYIIGNNITLTKKEEIEKLLLHELCHFFMIDLTQKKNQQLDQNDNVTNYMKDNWYMSSYTPAFEAFAEMFSVIFHCMFTACEYVIINNLKPSILLEQFEYYFNMELKYSYYLLSNVLREHGYDKDNFELFFNKDLRKKNKTNSITKVFFQGVNSYFILRTMLFTHIDDFFNGMDNFYHINDKNIINIINNPIFYNTLRGFMKLKHSKHIRYIRTSLNYQKVKNISKLISVETTKENLSNNNIKIKILLTYALTNIYFYCKYFKLDKKNIDKYNLNSIKKILGMNIIKIYKNDFKKYTSLLNDLAKIEELNINKDYIIKINTVTNDLMQNNKFNVNKFKPNMIYNKLTEHFNMTIYDLFDKIYNLIDNLKI
jgi:hypothetical protein